MPDDDTTNPTPSDDTTSPIPAGHIVLPLRALQHMPHEERIEQAARALRGQLGREPTADEVHAFAYPEGKPEDHKL